jgi:hypothetical protein
MDKSWLLVGVGLLGAAFLVKTCVMGGSTNTPSETADMSSVDNRVFTQIFICEDRAGGGRETKIAEVLSGVFLTQGKDMLLDVIYSNGYDMYCSIAVSPFAAVAMQDQQVLGSATGGFGPSNGTTLYLVRGSSNMIFAVIDGRW